MYIEGNILYFTPFYFKNGNSAKPKYFVVIKNIEDKTLLVSLPTSKDFIPEKDVISYGCVELSEINLNCFIISPSQVVTESGKKFDFQTYIYGHQLDTYELSNMSEIYQLEDIDYQIFGKMKVDLFNDLLDCLKNSKSVKNKYLKILSKN